MEEVDRLIIHALEQIGVSRLSSSSSSSITSLKDFTVEDVVEGVSRCLMAIDPSLNLPLKMPPAMAARYRIGADLASAVRGVGFTHREVGYQTFLYLNENDLRDIFVFLVESLPKEKMDDVGGEEEEVAGRWKKGADRGAAANAATAAAAMRRKCIEAIAADLKGGRGGSPVKGQAERPAWKKPETGGVESAKALDADFRFHGRSYCDFEAIKLKVPNFEKLSKIDGQEEYARMKEYHDEIIPWVWDQTDDNSVLFASLMERNARSLVYGQLQKASSTSDDYDIAAILKQSIASAKNCLAIEDYLSPSSSPNRKAKPQPSAKPAKPVKPAKLAKPKVEAVEVDEGLGAEDEVATEETSTATEDAKESPAVLAERVAEERRAALANAETNCEEIRSSLEKMKEEILGLHDAKSRKEEEIAQLATAQQEIAIKAEEWDKLSSLLPEAEDNCQKLEMRLANSQQKMIKLQEEWIAVRQPLEAEIKAASVQADVKAEILAKLTEDLAALTAKSARLKEDAAEKEDRLAGIAKQLQAAFPKGEDDEETRKKLVSRNSFTKRILEIVNNIKKQKVELDRIIADTKDISKQVNSLEGKLERSFSLADELVFKDAKKDDAVRKAYKLLAGLHETCGALVGVVEDIGTTVRGCRDKEDELEKEQQLEMESNLEKITRDLESMRKENAALTGGSRK